MSAQPVRCPACGWHMTLVSTPPYGVFKCQGCGFGTCLASEVSAINKRIEDRVAKELAAMRKYADDMREFARLAAAEIATVARTRATGAFACPVCDIALTFEHSGRLLRCAACEHRISTDWARCYSEELTRSHAAVLALSKLRSTLEALREPDISTTTGDTT